MSGTLQIQAANESDIGSRYPNQTTNGAARSSLVLGDPYGRLRIEMNNRQISSPCVYIQTSAWSTPTTLGYSYFSGTDGKITPQTASTGLFTSTSGASNYTNFKPGQKVVLSSSTTNQNGTDGNFSFVGSAARLTSASWTFANIQVGQSIVISGDNTPQSGSDGVISFSGSTCTFSSSSINLANVQVGQTIQIMSIHVPQHGTDGVIAYLETNGNVKLTSSSMNKTTPLVGQNIVISGASHSANNGTFKITAINSNGVTYYNPVAVSGDSSLTWSLQGNIGKWTVATVTGSNLTFTNVDGINNSINNIIWNMLGNNGTYTITSLATPYIMFSAPLGIAGSALTWSILGNNGTATVASTSASGVVLNMLNPTLDTSGSIYWNTLDTGYTDGKVTVVSGSTNTFTSATLDYSKIQVGNVINITAATNAGNKGIFVVTQVGTSSLQFTNASGVVETTGTSITFSLGYQYKTAQELIQSVASSTDDCYNSTYFVQFHSQSNGGTLTFQTVGSSVSQQETLVASKDYNYMINKIYINTTAGTTISSATDLVFLIGG